MTEKQMENIARARKALREHRDQEALDCYLRVNEEDSNVAEAAYWAYTAYWESCVDKQASAEDKWIAFSAVSAELTKAIEEIVESEGSDVDKLFVVCSFVGVYVPIADYAVKNSIADPKKRIERAVLTLYWTGDAIERNFGKDPDFMVAAAKAWKEGVKLQQQFYAYSYDGNKAEDYAEKIKKIEPDYEMPKKAGCISIPQK